MTPDDAKRIQTTWGSVVPIRDQAGGTRVYRKLSYGSLVDIVMLDTRLWARTKQEGSIVGVPPPPSSTRTLLGADQEQWLREQLGSSQARWKLIGQQVMVGNLVLNEGPDRTPTAIANLDQWHGYPESRASFLDLLGGSSGTNAVVLTGDIHSSWANDIVTQPSQHDEGRGSLGVEFEGWVRARSERDLRWWQRLVARRRIPGRRPLRDLRRRALRGRVDVPPGAGRLEGGAHGARRPAA